MVTLDPQVLPLKRQTGEGLPRFAFVWQQSGTIETAPLLLHEAQ